MNGKKNLMKYSKKIIKKILIQLKKNKRSLLNGSRETIVPENLDHNLKKGDLQLKKMIKIMNLTRRKKNLYI